MIEVEQLKYPNNQTNHEGKSRKVGIELEFANLKLDQIAEIIIDQFGGELHKVNPYHYEVTNTPLGRFIMEIDASLLKEMVIQGYLEEMGISRKEDYKLREAIDNILRDVAESVVPYEVSTPPIAIDQIDQIETLKNNLRKAGAKGTEDSLVYAFGLQLNPDVPSLEPAYLVNYIRAFMLFYHYLKQQLEVDFTRKLTPYVNPYSRKYTKIVLNEGYQPSMEKLIDDYVYHNPTRNRSLDLLPLFAFLDYQKVSEAVEDTLIKPRPTFHYRFPNSKVSLESWTIVHEWNHWVMVEKLAEDEKNLRILSEDYLKYLDDPFYFKKDWITQLQAWIDQNQ